ncbi:hypothetical protein Tco_0855568, partial [Tanacetum coccineum]
RYEDIIKVKRFMRSRQNAIANHEVKPSPVPRVNLNSFDLNWYWAGIGHVLDWYEAGNGPDLDCWVVEEMARSLRLALVDHHRSCGYGGGRGRKNKAFLHMLCILDGFLDVLEKSVKMVNFLLYLVSGYGRLGLSTQYTPREVDSWWWDCESKSGVESSAWVGDEGCVDEAIEVIEMMTL